MRRAIRDEQKEQRRQAILDVAWRLFQANSYDAVNMIDVARGTGLAKGTVYLYFKTKEELFLAILEQRFQEWFDEIDGRLQAVAELDPIPQIARLIAETLAERPSLTRLFAILHVILEKNVDYETVRHFKQMLLARITHTGSLLESRLPFLQPGRGAQLLMQTYALVIGFQHLADPAPVARQVLQQEPEMAVFTISFVPAFATTLQALLYGLERESAQSGVMSELPD